MNLRIKSATKYFLQKIKETDANKHKFELEMCLSGFYLWLLVSVSEIEVSIAYHILTISGETSDVSVFPMEEGKEGTYYCHAEEPIKTMIFKYQCTSLAISSTNIFTKHTPFYISFLPFLHYFCLPFSKAKM